MSLSLYNNDEKIELNYTVENNINPTDDYLKNMLKRIYFGRSIYFGGANPNDYSYYDKLITYTQNNYQLLPSMFTNGHIKLFDENNNLIGIADLSKAYSGADTQRGTVNVNECDYDVTNNAYNYKISIDFPTSAANGTIKTIKFYAYPYYDPKFSRKENEISQYYYNNIYTKICLSNNEVDSYGLNFNTTYLENGSMIYFDNFYHTLKYNNKIYNTTGISFMYYINGKFYTIDDNLSDSKSINITELVLNDEELTVTKSNNIATIDLSSYITDTNWYNKIALSSYNNNIYLYLFDDSDSYDTSDKVLIVKLDENKNIVNNFNFTSIDKDIFYLLNMNNLYNKKNVTILVGNNNRNNYLNIDYENDIFEFKGCRDITPLSEKDNYIYLNNNSSDITSVYDGSKILIKCNDKKYGIIELDENDYLVDQCERKNPLIYTFKEPVTKTSKQTMKLVFDITIS